MKHVTFSRFAYYKSRKSSKFANDYGKERIDSAVWRTESANKVG